MKKWIKKNYKIILIVLGFVLLGPMVINVLFKLPPSIEIFVAEWDASSMLSYYGTIIAAVIAIYGIFITIQYSQKSYKDDVRDRSMPFIAIEMLRTSAYRNLSKPNEAGIIEEQIEGYREYKLTDYYCILNKGKIEYKTDLTISQKKLLDNGGMKWNSYGKGGSMQIVDEICVPFEIENVGNGTAIRMRYGVNRKETVKTDRRYWPAMSLKPGTRMKFHIFSEDCSKGSVNLGEYVLSFYYEDIYSNRYEQHFDISIEYNEEKQTPVFLIDMGHAQKFLGGK